jgi:hypothetical protein
MSMPFGADEMREAIAAYARGCRAAYANSLQPSPTIVPPQLYDAIKKAVADGTAPDWVAARWDAGLFVPTERLLIDEGL